MNKQTVLELKELKKQVEEKLRGLEEKEIRGLTVVQLKNNWTEKSGAYAVLYGKEEAEGECYLMSDDGNIEYRIKPKEMIKSGGVLTKDILEDHGFSVLEEDLGEFWSLEDLEL